VYKIRECLVDVTGKLKMLMQETFITVYQTVENVSSYPKLNIDEP